MISQRVVLAATLCLPLLAAGSAVAGTVVPLAPFTAIEAHGGAHVTLHHGAVQRVMLVKGSLDVSDVTVASNTLMIDGCKSFWNCPRTYDLDIDVVSPSISRVVAHGGADVDAVGNFPRQGFISAQAHGGGAIDLRAISADKAEANAHGGGDIHLGVVGALDAEAHGGGDITYRGNPQPFTSNVHGGGSVSKE